MHTGSVIMSVQYAEMGSAHLNKEKYACKHMSEKPNFLSGGCWLMFFSKQIYNIGNECDNAIRFGNYIFSSKLFPVYQTKCVKKCFKTFTYTWDGEKYVRGQKIDIRSWEYQFVIIFSVKYRCTWYKDKNSKF